MERIVIVGLEGIFQVEATDSISAETRSDFGVLQGGVDAPEGYPIFFFFSSFFISFYTNDDDADDDDLFC